MYRLLLPACLAIPVFSANAADASDVWKPEQLNESYMRSQSKHQCMEKTISTLKFYCKDAACVKNLSGIVGDCVNWASGTNAEFCLNYDKRYVSRY